MREFIEFYKENVMKKVLGLLFAVAIIFNISAISKKLDYGEYKRQQENEESCKKSGGVPISSIEGGFSKCLKGNFKKSCKNCVASHRTLFCDCKTKKGEWKQNTIRMSSCPSNKFKNDNGNLVCEEK